MASESLRPKAEDFPSSHVPGDPLVTFPALGKSLAARRRRPTCENYPRRRAASSRPVEGTKTAKAGKIPLHQEND